MIELKPCPCCGPDGHPELHGSINRGGRFVRCEICGMQGPANFSQEKATTAWNTRANRDRIEALTAENERLTEAYNSLGNKAVEQVAKMGTEIGRKDCETDVLTADLTQSKREVERLREALGDIESIPDHSRHDDWEVSRKMQLIARAALAGKAEQ